MLMSGVIASLSLLPGCSMLDNTSTQEATTSRSSADSQPMTGEVLVTLKGKPAITTDSLAAEKEKFLKANPQIKAALGFMDPKAFDRNLLEGLIGQRIADEFVIDNGINKTAQYQAELRDLCESMERMLNAKFFSEKTTATVSDSEVKSFYDLNKDKLRGVIVSAGGVEAAGIEFDDAAQARAFMARAKNAQDFRKTAQTDNMTAKIKDFKLINNQSVGLDEVLRDKIAAIKTVPTVELIEANGKYWVVAATAKEEPKYRPYNEIRDALKQELEKNKRVELFEKEIDKLRKEYGVTVNEEYFKVEEASSEALDNRGGMAAIEPAQKSEEKRVA